jgi:hypothetical protein
LFFLSNNLRPKTDETTAHGRWTTDEDSTLEAAVKELNCNDWAAIYALVPGRTKQQCGVDGTITYAPRQTRRPHAWVNGQQMKTTR